jgi:hypothetical protein
MMDGMMYCMIRLVREYNKVNMGDGNAWEK